MLGRLEEGQAWLWGERGLEPRTHQAARALVLPAVAFTTTPSLLSSKESSHWREELRAEAGDPGGTQCWDG